MLFNLSKDSSLKAIVKTFSCNAVRTIYVHDSLIEILGNYPIFRHLSNCADQSNIQDFFHLLGKEAKKGAKKRKKRTSTFSSLEIYRCPIFRGSFDPVETATCLQEHVPYPPESLFKYFICLTDFFEFYRCTSVRILIWMPL